MAEPFLWSLLAVNVAWLALNVWHTRQNNRDADENLSIARDIQRQLGKVEVLNRAATRGVEEVDRG